MLSREKKSLRQIAHHLDSVILIGDQGVTSGVELETERALKDHELIKVKLAVGNSDAKQQVTEAICEKLSADVVQSIGHIVLLLRKAKKPNPKLSNLLR